MVNENSFLDVDFLENRNLTDIEFRFGEPISSEGFRDTEQEFNVTLHKDVQELYARFNGLNLKWLFYPEVPHPLYPRAEGNIQLLKFQDMMIGFEGRKWLNTTWSERTKKEDLDFFQRLKPFDYYGGEADQFVCLELSPESVLTSNLWLFNYDHYPLRMNIELNEYLPLLTKTKGIWGWQYFFTELDFENSERERCNCAYTIETYPQIFDDGFEKELAKLFEKKPSERFLT